MPWHSQAISCYPTRELCNVGETPKIVSNIRSGQTSTDLCSVGETPKTVSNIGSGRTSTRHKLCTKELPPLSHPLLSFYSIISKSKVPLLSVASHTPERRVSPRDQLNEKEKQENLGKKTFVVFI